MPDCREKILSNDYYDVITDYPVRMLAESNADLCYASIENLYSVVYFSRMDVMTADSYFFEYRSVPKLYGLMQDGPIEGGFDPNSLIVSGITQIQRRPLALTGQGCVIAIIDTGYRVIIMSSQQNHRKIKGSRWFSPTKKCLRSRYF